MSIRLGDTISDLLRRQHVDGYSLHLYEIADGAKLQEEVLIDLRLSQIREDK